MKPIESVKLIGFFVLLLYGIHIADMILPIDFGRFGILPRTVSGLKGIALSPLLHGSWYHIISNTVPLCTLLFMTLYFYPKLAFRVIVFGCLLSGSLTWLIGRSAYHIGASSLIYVLAAFLLVYGFMRKKMIPIVVSLVVAFFYGGMIWGVLPSVAGYVSWEGHLSGAIAGVALAYWLKDKPYE